MFLLNKVVIIKSDNHVIIYVWPIKLQNLKNLYSNKIDKSSLVVIN
jgi:hypothetical protein